jgi:hypothetical protein
VERKHVIVAARQDVVSSFTVIKGSMVAETYKVLAQWDFDLSKKANLDRLREENYIAASSATWLRDVAKVLNRRLDPAGRDRPLAILAQGGFPLDEWKPILLWHITRDEFLLRDFLINWLFDAYERGLYRIAPDDLVEYLSTVRQRGGQIEHAWTNATTHRVAAGLLKLAADFGLLSGGTVKEFPRYHLPERSLTYLIRAILVHESGSAQRMLASPEWRMYLMSTDDLTNELLRLHQFRALQFEQAGSLVQLSLEVEAPLQFAEELVA